MGIISAALTSYTTSIIYDLGKKVISDYSEDKRSEYIKELSQIVDNTKNDFASLHHLPDKNGQYSFHKSEEFLTLLVEYRIDKDFNVKKLELILERNTFIYTPEQNHLKDFFKILDRKIQESSTFKLKYFKANFEEEVFINSQEKNLIYKSTSCFFKNRLIIQ